MTDLAGAKAGFRKLVRIAENTASFDPAMKVGPLVSAACLARGMIARAMPHGDILGFAPPLVLTREDADLIVNITKDAVDEVGDQVLT